MGDIREGSIDLYSETQADCVIRHGGPDGRIGFTKRGCSERQLRAGRAEAGGNPLKASRQG